MVLPVGTISMDQVNTELGHSATKLISLNQSDVRALAGKSSGTISMDDLRGKSASLSMVTGLYDAWTIGFVRSAAPATGTMTPNTWNGATIIDCYESDFHKRTLIVRMSPTSLGRSFFSRVTVGTVKDRYTSSGDYWNNESGYTTWAWSNWTGYQFGIGSTYPVTFYL